MNIILLIETILNIGLLIKNYISIYGANIVVTTEEINRKLRNKRERISTNGYLVCNTCHGYYELQPEEKVEDFNSNCDCGGTLEYFEYFPYSYDNIPEKESPSILVILIIPSLLMFPIVAISMLLIYRTYV